MPNESIVDQFTAQVERFVRSPHVNEAEPVARFVAAVAPTETEEALDAACGPGLLAKAFAPRLLTFTDVDLTPAMVERARRSLSLAWGSQGNVSSETLRAFTEEDFRSIVAALP